MEDIDIDTFLAIQRSLLAKEKARLFSINTDNRNNKENIENNRNCNVTMNKSDDSISNASSSQSDISNIHFNSFNENIKDDSCNSINPYQIYDKLIENEGQIVKESKFDINNNSSNESVDNSVSMQKNKTVKNKSKHDMDPWITDAFYDYFPSLGGQRLHKEKLSLDRKQEYNIYLKKLAEANTSDRKKSKRNQIIEEEKEEQQRNQTAQNLELEKFENIYKISHEKDEQPIEKKYFNNSRSKLLEDLKHTDLPNIFFSNAIQERNKRVTQDKTQKNMEYQRDLINQIEEKKREVEALRAKEKAEEELLTKKLEEQLKTMQLEEELSKEKAKSDRARITNEQNHLYRMHLLSQLENDHKIYNPYDERKAHSENGKDILVESNPYNHFTNSAPTHPNQIQERHSSVMIFNDAGSNDQIEHLVPVCRRCHSNANNDSVCEICERKRHNFLNDDKHCVRCNNHLYTAFERQNGLCKNCQKTDTDCLFCRKHDNLCPSCNSLYCLRCRQRKTMVDRPSIQEEESLTTDEDSYHESERSRKTKKSNRTKTFSIKYNENKEHDLDVSPIVIRSDNKPYSMNVPNSSIFNKGADRQLKLNVRNGEVYVNENLDDIRRKTDERIAKYVRNYGELRKRPPAREIIGQRRNNEYPHDDSFPVPLMKYNTQKSQNIQNSRSSVSPAVKMLESKWTIPAVQKHTVKTKPIRVFTQLGAIRKQLQMEQLNFDSN